MWMTMCWLGFARMPGVQCSLGLLLDHMYELEYQQGNSGRSALNVELLLCHLYRVGFMSSFKKQKPTAALTYGCAYLTFVTDLS